MSITQKLRDLMMSAPDFQSAQDGIVQELREEYRLSRVNVLLFNKASNMLETVSSVGHMQTDFHDIRTPLLRQEGISSRAVQVRSFLEKRPIAVTDRSTDPEYKNRVRFVHKRYAREFAIFPLTCGARKLGILSIAVEDDNPTHLSKSLVDSIARVCPVIARIIFSTMPRLPSDRQMVKVLKEILQTGLIYPAYQPIVDLEKHVIMGYEALLRANHPLIAGPVILLGYAEKFNSLRDVSQIIHEAALKGAKDLPRGQKLFLNLHQGDFREYADLKLKSNPFRNRDPRRFVFEITERQYAQDIERLNALFVHYRRLGFGIAIDDLGSGYSSLNMLTNLELDYIKLDISLIRDLHRNDRKQKLVRALLYYCRETGCTCIAEGVETVEELEALVAMKARYVQGFLLARPSADLSSNAQLRRRLGDIL